MPVDQLTYGLPIREFLLVGLVSAVVTLLLTGPVRMLALKAGAVAWPRGRDVHVTPTPRWGGLAMFGGVLGGLLLSLQLPALRLAYFEQSTEVIGVVAATALIVVVGMLDDRYDLDAITKFAAQVTAGGLLVLYGVQWFAIWIPLGGGGVGISGSTLILGQSQSVLFTVLLTVGLVNAMNFVDGLDGLAAGIGLLTTLATAVFCIGLISDNGNDPAAFTPALMAVVVAGACLGFLPHNFNPARIFMGDTGSMMIGVMLSAAVTSASGRILPDEGTGATDYLALIAPLFVLVGIVFIPVLDLLLAVVRRTRAGTSPFSPDKMHLHHRLLQVGHSQRRAVLLVYLWVAVIAFGAVALALVPRTGLVLSATGVALLVVFVASTVPHRSRKRAAAALARATGGAPAPGDAVPTAGEVVGTPGDTGPGPAGTAPGPPPGAPGPRAGTAPGPGLPAGTASSAPPAPSAGPLPGTPPPIGDPSAGGHVPGHPGPARTVPGAIRPATAPVPGISSEPGPAGPRSSAPGADGPPEPPGSRSRPADPRRPRMPAGPPAPGLRDVTEQPTVPTRAHRRPQDGGPAHP
ncbi:glycosyltransferase family 4 protein [Pseudonocardia sp. HH130630-07]|uniref:glycosyltransferase family 4 protein n=1 Tax=Pseudonocardia sp. HH130630-07 TaxID=1690815 RepID=UPI000839B2AB